MPWNEIKLSFHTAFGRFYIDSKSKKYYKNSKFVLLNLDLEISRDEEKEKRIVHIIHYINVKDQLLKLRYP